eukprot:CAMPEP_0197078976 /NCGR_PEP_ID=MMETSP1384-20130603/213392_1 /TAXON_ID=29189 /ORGANISM="Ammonia sp." /LENGTH=462 /DNA_ID=CAMNT_0042517845 /DNA_START=61 /DNA_END=1449 /DNA_ORIENTATION=+
MVLGYFAGRLEEKIPRFNSRFEKSEWNFLPNQYIYVSHQASNKRLRVVCSSQTKVGDTRCCKVRLPIKRFGKKNVESEFDLVVVSQTDPNNLELIRFKSRRRATPRLEYRKGRTSVTARMARTERFCFKPLQPGKYQLRFEIVPACYGLAVFCDGLIANKPLIGEGSGDQETSLAPKDFQPPLPFTVLVPKMKLSEIKIVVQGSGQGDIVQVVNRKWFKIRVFFLGSIKGTVVITPVNKDMEFKPEAMRWNKGDLPFGSFKVSADVDCPAPNRILIVNYQIDDELMQWEIPTPSYLQIAPDPANQEEVNKEASKVCKLEEPPDICMDGSCIQGSKEEIAEEVMCGKYPVLCEDPEPPPTKPDVIKKFLQWLLYASAALLMFVIVYRNTCGRYSAAVEQISSMVKDLKAKETKLPSDAVNAKQLFTMAGFDHDEVFDVKNPNPVLIAEAQLSMEKMLAAMKKK